MTKQPIQAKPPATTTNEPQKTKDGRAIYEITDRAPPYVAGRRVNGATEIELHEAEARAELLAGHIWPKGMPRPASPQAGAGSGDGSSSV